MQGICSWCIRTSLNVWCALLCCWLLAELEVWQSFSCTVVLCCKAENKHGCGVHCCCWGQLLMDGSSRSGFVSGASFLVHWNKLALMWCALLLLANCCVAGSLAELLMSGCVVLQGLEQACIDVVCTAVVGVNCWWMDLLGQEISVEHLSLCIRRSLHGCGVH